MTVRLTDTAKADIRKAALRCEAEREGLGEKFLDRVDEAIGRIEANPTGYAEVIRDARKANLRQFPYALWFQIKPDNSLVIACLHHRRDSALAKERAAGILEIPKPPEP